MDYKSENRSRDTSTPAASLRPDLEDFELRKSHAPFGGIRRDRPSSQLIIFDSTTQNSSFGVSKTPLTSATPFSSFFAARNTATNRSRPDYKAYLNQSFTATPQARGL